MENNVKTTTEVIEKKPTREEKKAILTSNLVNDLNALGLAYRITSENFYMTKIGGYSVKCQMNQKKGIYNVICNKGLVDKLGLVEENYEFHQGWNMQYLLKVSLKDLTVKAAASEEKKEEKPAEAPKEETKKEEAKKETPKPAKKKGDSKKKTK